MAPGPEEAPGWRALWAIEMCERRPLWIINLLLACAAFGQLLGGVS